jgi:large-conductance mechanosensitive channel
MQNGDKNRDGFGHLVLFILFIIVAVVVFSAWKIVANKDTDSSTNKTDSSTSEEAEDKKSSLKITVLESGNKILPDGYA